MFPPSRRSLTVSFALGLFGLVLGAKWAVIERYGSDLPVWDQWDAEGAMLYLPYFQHHLGWLDFFTAHNEHRIFFTKLLSLGLLLVNGQWDARLECAVNAGLHVSFALAVFLYARRLVAARWEGPLALFIATVFALPLAWQNLLGGFHSQQYFLLWFSVAAIALLLASPRGSVRWWLGAACSLGALFSMASGLLAAAAVGLASLAVQLRDRPPLRDRWPTWLVCAAALLLGVTLQVHVSYHEPLKAHHFSEFFQTLWRSLQWPVTGFAPFALLSFAPWLLLALRWWRRPGPSATGELVVLAAGLWVALQFAATAYARGGHGDWPATRYLDTVGFGLVVNAVALALLLPPPREGARLGPVAAAVWLGLVGLGLYRQTEEAFTIELPGVAFISKQREENTRAYLASGDARQLDREIPYPSKDTLIERLSHPEIRAILPASVRPALPLTAAASSAPVFAPGAIAPDFRAFTGRTVWGSFSAAGLRNTGEWRSAPVTNLRPGYWRIETAGAFGDPRVGLDLVSATTGETVAHVMPSKSPDDDWRAAYVALPAGAFCFVAHDRSLDHWLAFSEPAELPALSYWAWRAVKHGRELAIGGGILLLATWLAAAKGAGGARETH